MENFEKIIKNLKADAALITSLENRRYLSGFNSHSGYFFITKNNAYLIVDFRYYEAAKKQVKKIEVILFKNLEKTFKKICSKHKIKIIFGEKKQLNLEALEKYSSIFNKFDIKFKASKKLDNAISSIRMIKTKEEIKKIKEAQRISEEAFKNILNRIKLGETTEKQIAFDIEFFMRKNGATGKAFDFIVVSGKNTSLPHGEPTDKKIKIGDFLTIDIGAIFEGYCSDMTRTIAINKVSDEQKNIYNIVLKAQLEGLKTVKPGIKVKKVDKVTRKIIKKEGYEKYFGHATGHSVGLQVHEDPRFSSIDETILKPNMIMTIEPGIYLPKKFGVRIEDMVVIKEKTNENLTSITKELIIL